LSFRGRETINNSGKNNEPNQYTAEDIDVLSGLEAVRRRPGMYIGSTGQKGLHHLVEEIVYNSIDEAMAGCCDKISVSIWQDGEWRWRTMEGESLSIFTP